MQSMPPAWSYAHLGDRLLARFDNKGNVQHVVTDHIGYPMATISYTGTVQWQPDPEPFGDVISEQPAGSSKHDPLIRYPGQWRLDPVLATSEPAFTTLYYNTHRWYNPSWGRYTQSDPIGLDGGVNLFAYAANNPIAFRDTSGLIIDYIRCAYWTPKCLGPGWRCWDDWYCYLRTLSDEELLDTFNRASRTAGFEISSTSTFGYWFCFVSREACVRAYEYCGKWPMNFPPMPRPRR